jgi:hypothetical protein
MKAFYGDKTLLETMTFIVPGFGETKIVLGEGSESLTFLLTFEKIDGNAQTFATEVIDTHTLSIPCLARRLAAIEFSDPT